MLIFTRGSAQGSDRNVPRLSLTLLNIFHELVLTQLLSSCDNQDRLSRIIYYRR